MLKWVAGALQRTCIASVPSMLVEVHLIVKFPSDIAHKVYRSLMLHVLVYLLHDQQQCIFSKILYDFCCLTPLKAFFLKVSSKETVQHGCSMKT